MSFFSHCGRYPRKGFTYIWSSLEQLESHDGRRSHELEIERRRHPHKHRSFLKLFTYTQHSDASGAIKHACASRTLERPQEREEQEPERASDVSACSPAALDPQYPRTKSQRPLELRCLRMSLLPIPYTHRNEASTQGT